jgi:hypothetical protein
MKFIAKDKELIDCLTGNLSLISSKLYKLDMYLVDDELAIDIYLKLLYAKNSNVIKLAFLGIKEFSIFYTSDYNFYNIESYKFIEDKGEYYLCLDPSDDKEDISKDDQDYILSNSVEGYFLNSQ